MASDSMLQAGIAMEAFLRGKIDDVEKNAGEAVEKATKVGYEHMKRVVETTTSPTGQARAGHGGSPGRIDTGQMISDIDMDVKHGARVHEGEWGWLNDFLKYYYLQEHWDGVSHMGAMHSIRQSYIMAREELYRELMK